MGESQFRPWPALIEETAGRPWPGVIEGTKAGHDLQEGRRLGEEEVRWWSLMDMDWA
jgi:hypothetical protein